MEQIAANSIETKDYLVTREPFVVEEKEKGISFTHPFIADEEIDKYYNTTDYLSHSSNKTLMSFFFDFFSKIMVKKKTSFMLGVVWCKHLFGLWLWRWKTY